MKQTDEVVVKYAGNEPRKAHVTDAAFDLRAAQDKWIEPGGTELVRTGTQVLVPEGYVGMVCSRSGLAAKHAVCVLNAPGIVDPHYIGDVSVVLHNAGHWPFSVRTGDRIAQFMVMPLAGTRFEFAGKLDDQKLERGDKGFGSSGIA